MVKPSLPLSKGLIACLLLTFVACSKDKALQPSQQKPTTTENAKVAPTVKTETTATTYGKIINVAFSSTTDGFDVKFTNSSAIIDKSNYDVVSYDWDFGDGKIETIPADSKVFTHTYLTLGNYNVKLTANVVDAITRAPIDGPFVSTKRINVIAIIPTASFTVNYSSDGVTAIFNNTSTNGATYSWDFGDKGTDILQNPNHLYMKEGTYTVKLTVTSKTGNTASTTQTVTIDATPIADFDFVIGDTVIFINKSVKGVSYSWDFGDGGTATSFNTAHEYRADGDYTVTLTVTGATGKTSVKKKVVSISHLSPIADFNFTQKDTIIGIDTFAIVRFTNISKNAVSYNWNFGDGRTSIEENPIHLYAFGMYNIELTATALSGKKNTIRKNVILR